MSLTAKGKRLWHASQVALGQLDKEISDLRGDEPGNLSIGLLTYFSSRWLSPWSAVGTVRTAGPDKKDCQGAGIFA